MSAVSDLLKEYYAWLQANARREYSRASMDQVTPYKDTCQICGSKGYRKYLTAHHPSYLFPLSVIWVCPSCHSRLHGWKTVVDRIQRAERMEALEHVAKWASAYFDSRDELHLNGLRGALAAVPRNMSPSYMRSPVNKRLAWQYAAKEPTQ